MLEQLLVSLLESQNPDGGWGFGLSSPSQTEATSLAIISFETSGDPRFGEATRSGKAWLRARQRSDGAWPRSDDVPEPSWMTSLAMMALRGRADDLPRVRAGAGWLLESRGRRNPLLQRIVARLGRRTQGVDLDETLRGWPWRPETFGWIEPTAYALLALKMVRPDLPSSQSENRIREGELMILDRMCPGGGWNYGNSRVLGEDLWPFPDTTALALMALQDLQRGQPMVESLQALERISSEVDSGLSLALSILCFRLFGHDTPDLKPGLEAAWHATAFRGETRPTALAVLALHEGESPFLVGTHG